MSLSWKGNTRGSNLHKAKAPKQVTKKYFLLHKPKTLDKKENACHRRYLVEIHLTGGGLRLIFQSGLYELFKAAIQQHISATCGDDYTVHADGDVDASGLEFITRFRVVSAASKTAAFTVNMFHTTSSSLINGPEEQVFHNKILPDLIRLIGNVSVDGSRISARSMNQIILEQITAAKQQFSVKPSKPSTAIDPSKGDEGRALQSRRSTCSVDSHLTPKLAILPSDGVLSETTTSDSSPPVAAVSSCPLCPVSPDTADSSESDLDMIECDSCSDWFHRGCLSISKDQWHTLSNEDEDFHCPACSHKDFNSTDSPLTEPQHHGPGPTLPKSSSNPPTTIPTTPLPGPPIPSARVTSTRVTNTSTISSVSSATCVSPAVTMVTGASKTNGIHRTTLTTTPAHAQTVSMSPGRPAPPISQATSVCPTTHATTAVPTETSVTQASVTSVTGNPQPTKNKPKARVSLKDKELDVKLQELNNIINRESTRERYFMKLEREVNDLKRRLTVANNSPHVARTYTESQPAEATRQPCHCQTQSSKPDGYMELWQKIHALEKDKLQS